jgi:esterase/lipase superfamily enzyme
MESAVSAVTRTLTMRLGRAALFVGVGLLTACAPHQTAKRAAPVPTAEIEEIFVTTPRSLSSTGQAFGEQRPRGMNFFRAGISVPPTHEIGKIEWPDETPDASTDFVVADTQVLQGQSELLRSVRGAHPGTETLVFVHGYNNTLSDSMYRLAQIRSDFGITMPTVLFSWLSAGDPRGYAYDRDSVLFSRDDFVEMLDGLTSRPGERVFLLAHSMGSQLVMEALRQAAVQGDTEILSRISGVVLMSPDIDPDLFRRQADAIGRLPQPFLIFTSRQDRALSIAGFITGRKQRLGLIDGPDKVKGLNVKLIDFTALADGEGYNHFVPVTSPAAVNVLRGMINQAGERASAFGDYMVLGPQPALVQ